MKRLLADTGGLFALLYEKDQAHSQAIECLSDLREPLLVPDVVLVELDFLLRSRGCQRFVGPVLQSAADGSIELVPIGRADVGRAQALLARYERLSLDLTDALVMAIAERMGIDDILGTDERDFAPVELKGGRRLRVLLGQSTRRPAR